MCPSLHLHVIHDVRFSLIFIYLPFYFNLSFPVFFHSSVLMHPDLHTDLDNLDSVENNLRHSSKGSNDAYDVTFSLTVGVRTYEVVFRGLSRPISLILTRYEQMPKTKQKSLAELMRSIMIFTDKSLTLKWFFGQNKNFDHHSMETDFWSFMLSIFSLTLPKNTPVDLAHDIPRPYAKKSVEYELNHFSINSLCRFIPSFGELDFWFVHRFFYPHIKQNLRRREFCNFRQLSAEKANCLTNAVFSQDLGTCKRFPSAFWTKSIPARDLLSSGLQ